MAKTFDDGIVPVAFYADEDLSGKLYYAVKPASTANYVKTANGASNPMPIGILQDDNGASVGMAVSVKTMGWTKALVAACDVAGNTCIITFGKFLHAGSDGKLYASGSGLYAQARSGDALTTGSAILNVFWMPIGACAHDAS
uniref:Head decoration protein n=1 Tax=viral metagenome TaxID=1070528 RepID=A0A6M3XS66_9ZZZZ